MGCYSKKAHLNLLNPACYKYRSCPVEKIRVDFKLKVSIQESEADKFIQDLLEVKFINCNNKQIKYNVV